MRKALAEAQQAFDEGEIPIGAVVVCHDRIIARAHNLTETLHDVTAHAEMQAITAAANELGGKYLTDCTLYVTVEPCTMCAGALGWSQIPRIVYGCRDEKRGYTDYAPHALHPKCTVTGGVLEDECRQLMQDFFKNKDALLFLCNEHRLLAHELFTILNNQAFEVVTDALTCHIVYWTISCFILTIVNLHDTRRCRAFFNCLGYV